MKNNISALLATLITLLISTTFTTVHAHITVATYNITHGKKNDWPKRQSGVCDIIKEIKADIYGLQEVIKDNNQFDAIKQTLQGFGYVGQPRSSGITGLSLWHRFVMQFAQDEYCPIFYNQDTIEVVASGTFGINGNGWSSSLLPRICTWGRFRKTATGKEFYVYNTHLDHKDEAMRTMQIKLIIDDIKERCGNTPVILMGDFNTTFADDMEKALADGGFAHGRNVATATEGPNITHEKGSSKKLIECDHILIKPKEAFNVKLYKVLGTMSDTTSDHNPVSMTFSLN